MNRLIAFLEVNKHAKKAQFVGFVAALCALFMSVSAPGDMEAKKALAVIQLFWLVLLTLSLTSIFLDFGKYVWRAEREASKKYDVPFDYVATATIGVILGAVIANLWRYIFALYSEVLAVFTVMIAFPSLIAIGSVFIAIVIKRNETKIAPIFEILADSIIVGVLTGVAGMYLQESFTEFFYLYWFTIVAPSVAFTFFVFVVVMMLYRKKKLLS